MTVSEAHDRAYELKLTRVREVGFFVHHRHP